MEKLSCSIFLASSTIAYVAGACGRVALPFFLMPTTSRRLLRRLLSTNLLVGRLLCRLLRMKQFFRIFCLFVFFLFFFPWLLAVYVSKLRSDFAHESVDGNPTKVLELESRGKAALVSSTPQTMSLLVV